MNRASVARLDSLLPVVLAIAVATLVFSRAWVTEDAYITFRVVDHVTDFHGPVFNLGERVQVFTHPLWFLLLVIPGFLGIDLYYASLFMGVAATTATIYLLAKLLPPTIAILATAILATSIAFLDFSTSGLEGSLTHLLIVGMLYAAYGRDHWSERRRSLVLVTLGALAVMNRMDLVFLVTPVVALAIYRSPIAMVGLAPAAGWYAFATLYYGSPVPNTVYAKLGAYSTGEALRHGMTYLADFAQFEPLHAMAAVGAAGLLGWGWMQQTGGRWRTSVGGGGWFAVGFALGLGALLYLGSIVFAGGGYMHGRLLTPSLVTLIAVAALYMQTLPLRVPVPTASFAVVGFGAFLFFGSIEFFDTRDAPSGITYERAHHSHLWLSRRSAENGAASPTGLDGTSVGVSLREYAEVFGPVSVRSAQIGQFGYFAGDRVTLLDELGLADAFVARQEALPNQRPGHIGRQVPMEYYRARGDLTLQPDWLARVRAFDPTLREDALADAASVEWTHPEVREQYERIRRMTTGPLLDADRLGDLVAFTMPSGLPTATEARAARGTLVLSADYLPVFGSLDVLLGGGTVGAPDGGRWNDERFAVALNTAESALTLDLGAVHELTGVDFQADANDRYVLRFSIDGVRFGDPWVAGVAEGGGLWSRTTDEAFQRTARYVRVHAIGGDGLYSVSRLDVWTEAGRPATTPGAPAIEAETAAGGDQTVTVEWLPPADNGGSPILEYVLQAEPGGHELVVPADGTLRATLGGLRNGQVYDVTVTAVTDAGTGEPSPAVTLQPEPRVVATRGEVTVRANFEPVTGTFRALIVGAFDETGGFRFDDAARALQVPDVGVPITIDLGRAVEISGISFLADNNDSYGITFSLDDEVYGDPVRLEVVPGVGLQLRETLSGFNRRARYLRLTPIEGDGIFALGNVEVFSGGLPVIR